MAHSWSNENHGQNIAESYAIDKLKFKDGDLVIDIGANWGTLKLFFDTRHEDLKIDYVGIEPGLDEYFCLERNVEVPSSRVFNIAIGEVSGRSLFYYPPLGADSSVVQPPEYDSTYEIDVLSLNDFLTREEFLDKRIRLLKLEAEGFEYEICKGASNIIQRIDYVAADLGWERGINRESPATEVIEFMIRHGFNIEKIGSVESLRFLFKNRTILD
jgi:FkbM family methyltransferase